MMRRKRRVPIISDSSEDDSPQPRKPSKFSKTQRTRSTDGNVSLKNSHKRKIKKRKNDGWSSDSSSILRPKKQVNKLPIITSGESSSTSDDEELVHPARRGALRELSDYETGYSSDKTTDTSPSQFSTTLTEYLDRSEYVRKFIRRRRENPNTPINELAFSVGASVSISVADLMKSRGSRIPAHRLLNSCPVLPKRMRIMSSDEDSDDNDPFGLNRNYRSVTTRSEARKVSRDNVGNWTTEFFDGPSTSGNSGSIQHQADRSQATTSSCSDFGSAVSDEKLSWGTVVARSSSCNNSKNRPISTSNIGDSDDSFPIKTSVRRGARVALRESDEDAGSQYPSTLKDMSLDSSSDESEYCPICFMHFKSQEVGTPENCDHSFCVTCIQEWAKNNNTCPVDRIRFNSIIVRSYNSRNVIREIPVETVIPSAGGIDDEWNLIDITNSSEDESFSIFDSDSMDDSYDSANDDGPDEVCSICFGRARNDNIILCDFCLNVFHLTCLNPPLRFIPVGNWFCPDCVCIYSPGSLSSESSSD